MVVAVASVVAALTLILNLIPNLRDVLIANQGAIGAVVGFVVSQLVQSWRDDAAERRAIAAERRSYARERRTARFDRVRTAYKTVLGAAWALQSARVQMIAGTNQANLARIDVILERVKGINDATELLALEEDTEDVRVLYRKLHLAFEAYFDAARASEQEIDVGDRSKRMQKGRGDVEALTKEIEALIPAKLRALEAL